MSTELKTLQAQRDAIKGQLISFDTFLSAYKKETDLIQLQLRLQRLTTVFEKFDSICDSLDVLDDSDSSKNERFEVLDKYFATTSKPQQFLTAAIVESNMPPVQTVQQSSSKNSVVTNAGTDVR